MKCFNLYCDNDAKYRHEGIDIYLCQDCLDYSCMDNFFELKDEYEESDFDD